MTFDEWWKDNSYKFPQADYPQDGHEEVAKAVWNAAIDAAVATIGNLDVYQREEVGESYYVECLKTSHKTEKKDSRKQRSPSNRKA